MLVKSRRSNNDWPNCVLSKLESIENAMVLLSSRNGLFTSRFLFSMTAAPTLAKKIAGT